MMDGYTPGPWKWWTSNSWKRLKRDDVGIIQNVLEPYVCSDGHPDLSVSDEDMALIAAAPAMFSTLLAARAIIQEDRDEIFDSVTVAGIASTMADIDRPSVERMDIVLREIDAAISKAQGNPSHEVKP